jgi:hypothetical protein
MPFISILTDYEEGTQRVLIHKDLDHALTECAREACDLEVMRNTLEQMNQEQMVNIMAQDVLNNETIADHFLEYYYGESDDKDNQEQLTWRKYGDNAERLVIIPVIIGLEQHLRLGR